VESQLSQVNFQQNHIILPSIPSVCCRTTLRKLEVWNCSNFQKKSKNRDTFDKNWNVSCHVFEYCHNSCSKCLPFARTHARRCPRHSSIALSMTRSGQCHAKHAENAASVYNTCLDKIVCYLQSIFNRNRKLKQQVSK